MTLAVDFALVSYSSEGILIFLNENFLRTLGNAITVISLRQIAGVVTDSPANGK